MIKNVIHLNEANFEQEVLSAPELVVVEFWAEWSDPCKAMTPILESVAEEQFGAVKVAKVNVEKNETLAEEYGVRAVPTLLIFNRGDLKDQIIGRATEQDVRDKLAPFK